MRKKLFLLILYVLSAKVLAQNASSPQPTTPQAQLRLGDDYLNEKDYANAMIWFRKAADQGNAAAQNNIGWLYQNGWGVKQDYAEAANWYRKAAEKGDATGQVNLGWLYRKGHGVQQDYAAAMAWFRKSADQNNAAAKANIGWLFEKGFGVRQDYAEAMLWFRKAADQGNSDALADIGDIYRNGWGVKQDYAEAATWYQTAAEHGNVKAQVQLGWLHQSGLGVEQSYSEAMAWYSRAADTGDSEAQTDIGYLYEQGLGVTQDYAKAMAWYRRAADQGNGQAESKIGSLYEKGLGVPQDHSEAEAWYKKAADHILLPGGIRAPRAIYSPDPEYSKEAREAKFQGTCVLWLIVGADGNPRDIKVQKSLGKGLDEKAIDAIKTWKFEPATKDGVPVATQINIEVSFRLYGSFVGKVNVTGDSAPPSFFSYVSPIIRAAEKCWEESTEDKSHAPSVKEGQVTVQFRIENDGQLSAIEVTSSSGDVVLDHDAVACISPLKAGKPFPVDLKAKKLITQMQLLYKTEGFMVVPEKMQVAVGNSQQFRVELAGNVSETAGWSVTGAGCKGSWPNEATMATTTRTPT